MGRIHVISRVDPGDLSACEPAISRRSSEGIGLHWLHSTSDTPPPAALVAALGGQRVLNACGPAGGPMEARLRRLGARAVYSIDPPALDGDGRHITQQWAGALSAQGMVVVDNAPVLAVPAELRAAGRELLRSAGSIAPTIAVHPGSGGRRKCWPIGRFVDVAERLRGAGLSVVGLLGPAELERLTGAELAALRASMTAILMPEDGATLARVIGGADVYLGNDAGPTHLAALVGTPVVALFGPTSAAIWRPLGRRVRVVTGGTVESGGDWEIDVGQVVEAVQSMVEQGRV